MKKKFKSLIAVVCCASIVFGNAVQAAPLLENIRVARNSSTIYVGNEEITADNFIYNDTTYVPLRAVCEALNCDVYWDDETRTTKIYSNTKILAIAFLETLRILDGYEHFSSSLMTLHTEDYIRIMDYVMDDYTIGGYADLIKERQAVALQHKEDLNTRIKEGQNIAKESIFMNYLFECEIIDQEVFNTFFSDYELFMKELDMAYAITQSYIIDPQKTYIDSFWEHIDKADQYRYKMRDTIYELKNVIYNYQL